MALARRVAEAVGVALFAGLFGAFLLQVFMRYVMNRPLGWTDELSLLLYPWAVFWTCAFILKDGEHVRFDVLTAAAGRRARRLFAAIGGLATLGLFAAALPDTLDWVRFMARERTPVLDWRYHYVFAVFPLFMAAVAGRAAWALWRLARGAEPPA